MFGKKNAEIARLKLRVEFLEDRLSAHTVFKSSAVSHDPDWSDTIVMGLGREIMKHHLVQHTEHGTSVFVEVRALNALPEKKQ